MSDIRPEASSPDRSTLAHLFSGRAATRTVIFMPDIERTPTSPEEELDADLDDTEEHDQAEHEQDDDEWDLDL